MDIIFDDMESILGASHEAGHRMGGSGLTSANPSHCEAPTEAAASPKRGGCFGASLLAMTVWQKQAH